MSARKNAFAALGWLVWKLLALVGLPIARRKLEERQRARSGNAVVRRLRGRSHR